MLRYSLNFLFIYFTGIILQVSPTRICFILPFSLWATFYILISFFFAMSILFIIVPCWFLREATLFDVTYRYLPQKSTEIYSLPPCFSSVVAIFFHKATY